MKQNFLKTPHRPNPHFLVFVKETCKETLDFGGELDVVWEGELLVDDGILDFIFVLGVEGRQPGH